ncbi:hypothetical protein K2173_023519 [Erythroxylum novogranatense]|uniref:Uncharacterized protein n=1 Tax=Erythroxylum novogranatense TaxID=1862640 RepID=A0AAV8TRL3_9ROSI|nr:hypothetical protein K2173_023519 [Erythroxylum novogranatense]
MEGSNSNVVIVNKRSEIGKPIIGLICGTLVYYHCAYRNSSLVSLFADVLIMLLCSLAILGLLFLQLNISYPTTLNLIHSQQEIVRWYTNTNGKPTLFLFSNVSFYLYILSILGRVVSGVIVAYTEDCMFVLQIGINYSSKCFDKIVVKFSVKWDGY